MNIPTPSTHERLLGGMIGTLVGDALGVPVEFTGRSMRDKDPVTGMRAFGTWNQPAGTWSDDSSMTLAAADVMALAERFADACSSHWQQAC